MKTYLNPKAHRSAVWTQYAAHRPDWTLIVGGIIVLQYLALYNYVI